MSEKRAGREDPPILTICGGGKGTCGGGDWRRIRRYCPWCQERRRAITREVFGGYGSDGVCGWCGTWYQDGTADLGRRVPESQRNYNRELVRRVWREASHG